MKRNAAFLAGLCLLLLPAPASAQALLGDTTWVRVVGDPNLVSFGTDACADASGNAYFCGRSRNGTNPDEDVVVAKYNEWGDELWVRYIDGEEPSDFEDIGHALALDASGNVYVAGQVESPGDSMTDMVVAKYSPDGTPLWTWVSGVEEEDIAYDIAVGSNQVYACGTASDLVLGLSTFSIVRLDPSTGAVVWRRDTVIDASAKKDGRKPRQRPDLDRYPEWYEDWDDWDNCATTIAIAPNDGNVVATGYGYEDASYDEYEMWTMKLTPSGDYLWAEDYGRTSTSFDDAAFDMAIATDGTIYITGMGENDFHGYSWLTKAYSSSGNTAGVVWYDSPEQNEEWANAICLDNASPQNVYVTGFADRGLLGSQPVMMTIKYNHGLSPSLWGPGGHQYAYLNPSNGLYEYPNFGYDISYAQGHVYVTGRSGLGGSDVIVACYDTANADPKTYQWVRLKDLPKSYSYECGNAVYATDTMHIYVAGYKTLYNPYNPPQLDSIQMLAMRWFVDDRDVRVDNLLAPGPVVDQGTSLDPQVVVFNEGNDRSSFDVEIDIDTLAPTPWHDVRTVTNLLPNTGQTVTFSSWTAGPLGALGVRVRTKMTGDRNRHNDTLRTSVFVAYHDVGPTSIVVPGSTVDSGVAIIPQVWFENFGNVDESFQAQLEIGAYYTSSVTVNVPAGGTVLQPFASWTPRTRGDVDIECTSLLASDMNTDNDVLPGQTFVRVVDLEAVEILEPTGAYSLNTSVIPEARWRNNGNVAADFDAWMVLIDPLSSRPYVHSLPVTGLAPDAEVTLSTFPPHTLDVEGTWRAKCSTWIAGELKPVNDTLGQSFLVGGHPDVAVTAILAPVGVLDTADAVVPRARLHNGGDIAFLFDARMVLRDPGGAVQYDRTVTVPPLTVGADTVVSFPEWPGSIVSGNWTAACSLAVDDERPENDRLAGSFRIRAPFIWPEGWVEVEPMPTGQLGRAVKRGGALTTMGAPEGLIYATKGYKTGEFYAYHYDGDSWATLEEVPPGREGKLLEKGARLASNNVDRLWLTKGNNTLGFWTYDPDLNTWTQLDDIPEGPTGKKVKGGTDLAYVDIDGIGYVYMLKGYKTEFWRFNTVTGLWEAREDAPTGSKDKWDKGSWLAYDGENTIYAHKAKYYTGAEHEFYKYDIPGDTWSAALSGMPLYGWHSGKPGKKKKAKDGGCGVWVDGTVWALKGGNTQQFFSYNCETDTWTERDTIPTNGSSNKKRRVKTGGDMVLMADALWALKGNKTLEFWLYGFPSEVGLAPARSGVAAGPKVLPAGWEFEVRPNPLSGGGALYYAVPFATTVSARLYDAAGRAVRTLIPARPVSGRGALRLDTEGLARGVYLFELEAGGASFRTLKLVIE